MVRKSKSFFEAFQVAKPGRRGEERAERPWWQQLTVRRREGLRGTGAANVSKSRGRPLGAFVREWSAATVPVPRGWLIGAGFGALGLAVLVGSLSYVAGRAGGRRTIAVVEETRVTLPQVARGDDGAGRAPGSPAMFIPAEAEKAPSGKPVVPKQAESPPVPAGTFYSLRLIGGLSREKAEEIVDVLKKQGHGNAFCQAVAREGGRYAVYVGRFERPEDRNLQELKSHFSREKRFAGCYIAEFTSSKRN